MSRLVGRPVAGLIDAARGNTEVVKSAVDALRELAKQPYRPADGDSSRREPPAPSPPPPSEAA